MANVVGRYRNWSRCHCHRHDLILVVDRSNWFQRHRRPSV